MKSKVPLDQTTLGAAETTPILEIESGETPSKQKSIKAKAVIVIDPITGLALGASDFFRVIEHQADAVLSQANPVSATLYEVLATTENVRIIDILTSITWAVTQPTPLEIVVTIDGRTIIFSQVNPVSASIYSPYYLSSANENGALSTNLGFTLRSFLLEGRSVRIQMRITWAVTQPTPLVCRVKWAKW